MSCRRFRLAGRVIARFDALPEYRTSPLFTEAERAALDYTTELTTDKKVKPGTFERLAGYYSEREICEIVWLVASEHLNNMTNIGLSVGSDGLCELNAVAVARQADATVTAPERAALVLQTLVRACPSPSGPSLMPTQQSRPDAGPSPLEQLPIEQLRARTSMKWCAYPADILPPWVAEMDVPARTAGRRRAARCHRRRDTGYPAGIGYAPAQTRHRPDEGCELLGSGPGHLIAVVSDQQQAAPRQRHPGCRGQVGRLVTEA